MKLFMFIPVLLTLFASINADNLDSSVYGSPSPTYAPRNSSIVTVPDYNAATNQNDTQTNRGSPSQNSTYFQGQRDAQPQGINTSNQYGQGLNSPGQNAQGINTSGQYGQDSYIQGQNLQGTYNQGQNLQGTYNQNQYGQNPNNQSQNLPGQNQNNQISPFNHR